MSTKTIKGKIKRLKKMDDDFNILFIKSDEIEEKYKTNFGTYVVQGIGMFSENETVTFTGDWHHNKKYDNWTFKFIDYEKKKPEKTEEIVFYLQSEIFKGIGPILAHRIVDLFKENTLKIIDETPERLLEVEGIGLKKYEKLMSTYKVDEGYKELVKLLATPPINLSSNMISRIYKELGKNAIIKIAENPYILCSKVSRIGFKTTDFIARERFNVDANDISRIGAGILYTLNEAASTRGHLYLPIGELYNNFKKHLPDVELKNFNETIKLLNNVEIKILVNKENTVSSPVVIKRYYDMEKNIASCIRNLSRKGRKIKSLNKYIQEVEDELGIKYAEKQLEALRQIDKSNFFVITGGPGTGKSTIINGILQVLHKHNTFLKVIMAAPTGRASKRMEETTGREAATIHRTLEFKPGTGFTKNSESPLSADVIIIDESSMIDVYLMNSLISAIGEKTKVIFVGDIDQLPSVGPGSVLGDLIESNVVPVVRLNQVFRQGKDSLIKVNAQNIREGNINLKFSDEEFKLIDSSSALELQSFMVNYFVDELLKEKERTNSITQALYNVQILTPTKMGLLGTVALNNAIQEFINPNKDNEVISKFKDSEGEEISIKFRVADKVLQTTNNYEKDVFNGDLGIITDIEKDGDDFIIQVTFEDGRVVEYTKEELKGELVHAYAVTIHKSQGSEYRVTLIVCSSMQNFMNQRNLLYTAVTRAKYKVMLFGDTNAIQYSINKVYSNNRYTLLKNMLQLAS